MSACAPCLRRSALIGILAAPIANLLDSRKPPPELLRLPEPELLRLFGTDTAARARKELRGFDPDRARADVEDAGLFAVCRHDPGYPARLAHLSDAPAVLYGRGSQSRLGELVEEPAVAVVGTRRASAYGLEVARELGRALSVARVTVVSGMALGIDAAAHRGAIEAGGNTIAVLACGAESAYPRTNEKLYCRIAETGVVIGELPPRTEPRRWTFPARNRIMAGLAQVTVVVEAAERSGSLITARFAAELGREVAAVPGRITSRMAAGSNRLLRDGAHVILGPADVLDALFGPGGWEGEPRPGSAARGRLDEPLRNVLDAVEAGESPDAAGRRAGLSTAEARAALGRLELLGLVRRDGLGFYERCTVTAP